MENQQSEKQWYVVHTYSGYENSVKTNLEKRVETMDMQDKIFRVMIPEQEETSIVNGKQKTMKKKTFPGYVLVELVMTDDSWYVVRNTPGVTGFVGSAGSGSKPSPLLPEEVRFLLKEMGMSLMIDAEFDLGEHVRIISGPFVNLTGEIVAVDQQELKLDVLIEMMGRETKVEVEMDQVEKM